LNALIDPGRLIHPTVPAKPEPDRPDL